MALTFDWAQLSPSPWTATGDAQTATGRIAATIFYEILAIRTLGHATISRHGRSRAPEAGHLGKFGFPRSVEAALMIDRFASLLASVRSAMAQLGLCLAIDFVAIHA